MPLVAADEASPRRPGSPTAPHRPPCSPPCPARPQPSAPAETDAHAPSYDDPTDDRPTPVFDRSMTDTASLLRELSGLFHSDDPEPSKPSSPVPALGPAPAARQEEEGPVRPRLSPGDDRRDALRRAGGPRGRVSVDGQVVGALRRSRAGRPPRRDAHRRRRRKPYVSRPRSTSCGSCPGERSAAEVGAPLLVVSQFTLYADTQRVVDRRGPPLPRPGRRAARRGSWPRSRSRPRRDRCLRRDMQVSLVNDGPVTLILEV